MDGAVSIIPILWRHTDVCSSKQAYYLRRRFCENKAGASSNENPGKSRM